MFCFALYNLCEFYILSSCYFGAKALTNFCLYIIAQDRSRSSGLREVYLNNRYRTRKEGKIYFLEQGETLLYIAAILKVITLCLSLKFWWTYHFNTLYYMSRIY